MATVTDGEQAVKIAMRSEPRLRAAFLSALSLASDAMQVTRVAAYIKAGDLMGLNAYLQEVFRDSLIASKVIQVLDSIVKESGEAAEASINAYLAVHPGAVVPQSIVPFAVQGTVAGEVMIATNTPEFNFNIANPNTVRAMTTWQGQLIQEMNAQMRRSVLNQITDGIVKGQNPRTTAVAIKQNLGLTSYQQSVVSSFGKDLDRFIAGNARTATSWGLYTPKQIAELAKTDPRLYKALQFTPYEKANGRSTAKISRAVGGTLQQQRGPSAYRIFADGTPMDGMTSWRLRDKSYDRLVYNVVAKKEQLAEAQPDQLAKAQAAYQEALTKLKAKRDVMEEAYRRRMVSNRASTLARTESLRAANLGSNESWRQLMESGMINKNSVYKKWLTAKDDRVRLTHRWAGNQRVQFDEPFRVDGDAVQYPPHNPNCRCTTTYEIA